MANRHRGEIEAELGGKRRVLVLTLGALAELEAAFAVADLGALAERFASGKLSASDAIKIVGAGLRGAGETISDEEVAALTAGRGAAGFAGVVADLLRVTFGGDDGGGSDDSGSPA